MSYTTHANMTTDHMTTRKGSQQDKCLAVLVVGVGERGVGGIVVVAKVAWAHMLLSCQCPRGGLSVGAMGGWLLAEMANTSLMLAPRP